MNQPDRNQDDQEQELHANLRALSALEESFETDSGLNRPISESTGDILGHDYEDTDFAQVLSDREVSGTLVGLLAGNREQVEHALQRLAQGEYGICEECGTQIPQERLHFFPAATRCVACQADHDRLNRRSA
ncbi:MAG TPA: TraR/DksA C4-type zinc finger protein [Candidatus Nitrosotalea sp.]|nr:TraR/DksA C4-type zinc finger protein [Candidatus Nitrosotalea sp.]